MIPLIIDYLSKRYKLESDGLSAALVNGGYYRAERTYRNTALVFKDGSPYIIARWYETNNPALTQEAQVLKYLNQLHFAAHKFIEQVEINNQQVLFEEFLAGDNLEHALALAKVTSDRALAIAVELFDALQQKTRQA